MTPLVSIVTAGESAACDAAATGAGVASRDLMRRAGTAAAAEIVRAFGGRLGAGVAVLAGPGNNGGDAWVVAGALAAEGVPVRVWESGPAKTADAIAERKAALPLVVVGEPGGDEAVVVDGLLGTGATGAPRGAVADGVARLREMRARGAAIVALDVPTGVDASTGAVDGAVPADLTVTFGTMKRGHLVARDWCGRVVVVDIGLGEHGSPAGVPQLVDARWVAERVPPIPADAHKGTRKRLVVVGGAEGMCGAAVLAGRAALRSGVGMVRLLVAPASLVAAQAAAPEALGGVWPTHDASLTAVGEWADAVVLGPGLGRSDEARALAEHLLEAWRGPVLLDADALNIFAGRMDWLAVLLGGRPAILTPHPAEMARLVDRDPHEVLARRFEVGAELAERLRAVVLLKGVPTVVSAPDSAPLVSAAGSAALATAGSGDLLSGVVGTLLAQMDDSAAAAACGAWAHGRAAELAGEGRSTVRGLVLDDVLGALGRVWDERVQPRRAPVLAELPHPSAP